MAMSAQEVHDKLEPRVRKVEAFRWWVTGVGAAAFILISSLSFFGIVTTVAVHESRIAAIESKMKEEAKDHATQVEKLRDATDKLREANERLRSNVLVLWDRQPKPPAGGFQALVYSGRIIDVGREHITILSDDPGEPARQFPLGDLKIHFKRKPIGTNNVKIGWKADIVTTRGEITEINVYE